MFLSVVGLQDRMNHLPSELSGGEKQRVYILKSFFWFLSICIVSRVWVCFVVCRLLFFCFVIRLLFCLVFFVCLNRTIARALANEPELLLLDEPTGDLDTKNTIEIMDLILSINIQHKTTCVMVSHNPDVECYADRILYLSDGRFIKQAINLQQSKLNYDEYIQYVNKQHTSVVEKDIEDNLPSLTDWKTTSPILSDLNLTNVINTHTMSMYRVNFGRSLLFSQNSMFFKLRSVMTLYIKE